MKKLLIKTIYLVVTFLSLLSIFGCGGSGNGTASTKILRTISGQVFLPAEAILSNARAAVGDSKSIIKVWLEQLPSCTANCDGEGKYTLPIPQGLNKFNIVASANMGESSELLIQRSKMIHFNEEKDILQVEDLTLSKGVNRLVFTLKGEDGKLIRYAKCSIWGKEFESDIEGRGTSFVLPENTEKVELTVSAVGYRTLNKELPVFSADLGPDLELYLSRENSKDSYPLIYINKFKNCIEPESVIDLSAEVLDPSGLCGNKLEISWSATEGSFLSSVNDLKCSWKAQEKPGLATISVVLTSTKGKVTASVGIEVGKSRFVNPRIFEVVPNSGYAGQTIKIKGTGFNSFAGQWNIVFGGAKGSVLSQRDDEIEVKIPIEAESAPILMTLPEEECRILSQETFNVNYYSLSLDPDYGLPGATIRIKGYGFGNDVGTNSISLDGEEVVDITSWNNRYVDFIIGSNATSGNLKINLRGKELLAGMFSLTELYGLSKSVVNRWQLNDSDLPEERTRITLKGENFGEGPNGDNEFGECGVRFKTIVNGDSSWVSAKIDSWTQNRIVVELPEKAVTGQIELQINGTKTLSEELTIRPPKKYMEYSSFGSSINTNNFYFAGIAPRTNGGFIVTDYENNGLWLFDDNNELETRINLSDEIPGCSPYGICALPSEEESYYISDWKNDSIIKIVDGSLVERISSFDSDSFRYPRGMTVDWAGNLYVVDSDENNQGNRIVIFDSELQHLCTYEGESNFQNITSVAVSETYKKLYVSDLDDHSVHVIEIEDPCNPSYMGKIGYDGTEFKLFTDGRNTMKDSDEGFSDPAGLWVDENKLYVLNMNHSEDTNGSVYSEIELENYERQCFGNFGYTLGQYYNPLAIMAVGGRVYICDTGNNRIQTVKDGNNPISIKPNTSSMSISNIDIAVNTEEQKLYVLDAGESKIKVFDYYGNYYQSIGSYGSKDGELKNPSSLCLDTNGNLYVCDTGNSRIVKFTSNGDFEFSFGNSGTGANEFRSPQRLFVDKKDNNKIYVSDYEANQIKVFTSDGSFVKMFGTEKLSGPMGIAVAEDGSVYVADSNNCRVCKYDNNYQMIGWLGNGGYQTFGDSGEEGESACYFKAPANLAIDQEGCLFVVDYGRGDIQKFNLNEDLEYNGGHIYSFDSHSEATMYYSCDFDEYGSLFAIQADNTIRRYIPVTEN